MAFHVGGDVAKSLGPERIWFASEIGRVSSALNIKTWEEMRGVLIPCFYLERVHLVPLKELWAESQAIKSEETNHP